MRYAYATLRRGYVCLFLLPDTFQVDDELKRAGIFAQEFGDAVICEGDFKRAFKAATEFPPGVTSFADVLYLHAI